MTDLERALRDIAAELDSRGVPWCLVGGLAVGSRAEPRTTRDVDVAVAVENDREAEALMAELRAVGYQIGAVVEQQVLGRLATVRSVAPVGNGLPVTVGLLFASSGIEDEICAQAERIEVLEDLTLPVARTGHLIAMKLLAREDRLRPQDYDDLVALAGRCDEVEIERARKAVTLIEERGANRERDLTSALRKLLAGNM